jgi:hypothetical protein
MDTLLLDANWDLTVDGAGNIATAYKTAPVEVKERAAYALAQDAASAIRLFAGELWYDTTQGVPYFSAILGQQPPDTLMKASFVAAALTVPGVVKARCFLNPIVSRIVSGTVEIEDAFGNTATAAF